MLDWPEMAGKGRTFFCFFMLVDKQVAYPSGAVYGASLYSIVPNVVLC
jgi:hypothetical protein